MASGVWTVLVAASDAAIHKSIRESLAPSGNHLVVAESVASFFDHLSRGGIDLIIFDPDLLPMSGAEAFAIAKAYHPDIPAILVNQQEDYALTRELVKKGVVFRMLKPIDKAEIAQLCQGLAARKSFAEKL